MRFLRIGSWLVRMMLILEGIFLRYWLRRGRGETLPPRALPWAGLDFRLFRRCDRLSNT